MYQTECYKQKRNKLKARLEETMHKILNTSVPLESLLGGSIGEK
jgi:hypothetical protein